MCDGKTVACILANGKTIVAMEKGGLFTLIVAYMKEISFVIKHKERVSFTTLMVQNTRVIGETMREKVMEYYHGKMAKNMMEVG